MIQKPASALMLYSTFPFIRAVIRGCARHGDGIISIFVMNCRGAIVISIIGMW